MIKIVLTGVITAVLILVLKEQQKGIAAILLLAGSLAVFLFCVKYLETIIDLIEEINDMMKIDRIYIKILLKIIGIAYVCQFSGDICRDLGSQTLGKQIESAGKLAVLISGIPVIQALLDTMKELLQL
jgi:stage III sporulation protein AD